MRYNIKKILSTSALALILSLGYVDLCSAQGIVSLGENAKADNNANEIPDEISLFGDTSADVKVITPAKPASGVKSAKDLLNNNSAPAANSANAGGVKSAQDLLAPQAKKPAGNVKSAAELLSNQPKDAGNVKNAAALLQNSATKALSNANNSAVGGVVTKPETKETPSAAAKALPSPINNIETKIVRDVEDTVFDQMSDLEKQTAILNLELKKEKVKSDIESLKAVQEKAREEEKARIEEKKRKQQEWENEEKRKILQEQQKLKDLEIAYEKQRQETLLKNYKNKMLAEKQDEIASREELYKEIENLRSERQSLISDFKGRFTQLTKLADEATSDVIRVRDEYAKTISDLQTQISILKARLEANEQQNPFAEANGQSSSEAEDENKLSDMYAVMEVRGQGDKMTAKLINNSGIPFMVKVGTALQSGHIIDEITTTYVRADKEGKKDYLYFSAGGILDKEPEQNEELTLKVSDENKGPKLEAPAVISNGIPGVAAEMTVR